MQSSRRTFLLATALASVIAVPAVAQIVQFSGGPSVNRFNGNKVQLNLPAPQADTSFPFLNAMKCAQNWSAIDNAVGHPEPSILDTNGYPTSITHSGVYTIFFIANQTDRPGNWVIKWTGKGVIYAPFSKTIVSGSLNNTGGGAGRCVVTPTGAPTSANILRITIGIVALDEADRIQNIVFVHASDEPALDAGNIYRAEYILGLINGGIGSVRGLDLQVTNLNNLTKWEARKPLNYVFYDGVEFRASLYAGVTTNSGDNYSVAAPSEFPGLVQGATVHVKFNASASGKTTGTGACTLNIGGTGAKQIWGIGAIPLIAFNSSSSNEWPTVDMIATLVYDADLGVWMKYGGDTINFSRGLNGGAPAEVLINLANSGGFHPWFNIPIYAVTNSASNYASELATLTKAMLSYGLVPRFEPANELWNYTFFGTSYVNAQAGILWYTGTCTISNASPAVVSRTAHGLFPGAGVTFRTTGTLPNPLEENKAYYLISAGFGSNSFEIALTPGGAAINTTTAGSGTHTLVPVLFVDFNNPYGRAVSLLGQAVSTVYMNNRTRYEIICAVQTFGNPAPDDRLAASLYVSRNSGSAAYNWATVISCASYYRDTYTDAERVTAGDDYVAAVGAPAKLVIATAFTNSCTVDGVANNKIFGLPNVKRLYAAWKAWGEGPWGGSIVIGKLMAYEGGWSPDYVGVVFNPLVNRDVLYSASRYVASLNDHTVTNCQNFIDEGGTFPSQFYWAGPSIVWSMYDPTIYSAPSTAAAGYASFG